MKIPNDKYSIEKCLVKPEFSFYQNLKFIIKQAGYYSSRNFFSGENEI